MPTIRMIRSAGLELRRRPPPKNIIRSAMSDTIAITPTSTATSVINRTSLCWTCASSWLITPSISRLSIVCRSPVVTQT